VALLEKRRYLNNHSGDFPQVILIVPSHVPNTVIYLFPTFQSLDLTPGLSNLNFYVSSFTGFLNFLSSLDLLL
jgi:hypothetical protein